MKTQDEIIEPKNKREWYQRGHDTGSKERQDEIIAIIDKHLAVLDTSTRIIVHEEVVREAQFAESVLQDIKQEILS